MPADHPLRSLPNVIGVPHRAFVTEAAYRTYLNGAVEDIAAWRAGALLRVLNA